MATITLAGHFDGERILLDAPYALAPDAKLLITVLGDEETEREAWLRFSAQQIANAYGDDEDEYTQDDIRKANPNYGGR